jgi:hypothetical protein
MYTPGGRTGRTPGSVNRMVAAVAVALMGMGGVALAAPKTDPGPPEQAQGNGPPPQAQDPAPPPQAKANGLQGAGKPADVPQGQPVQTGGAASPGAGQSQQGGAGGDAGHHGRPAPGETRGRAPAHSNAIKASGCQAARCRGGTPDPSAGASAGGEPSNVTGGQDGAAEDEEPGASKGRSHDHKAGSAPDEGQIPESGSVLGLDQGGGEEIEAAPGSFDGALPFTGFELALLAGVGALLGLAGIQLRRWAG